MTKTTTRFTLALLMIGLSLPAIAGDEEAPIDHVTESLGADKHFIALRNVIGAKDSGRAAVSETDFVVIKKTPKGKITAQGTRAELGRLRNLLKFLDRNLLETVPGVGGTQVRNVSGRADLDAFLTYVAQLDAPFKPTICHETEFDKIDGKRAWKRTWVVFRSKEQMTVFDYHFRAARLYHAALVKSGKAAK